MGDFTLLGQGEVGYQIRNATFQGEQMVQQRL